MIQKRHYRIESGEERCTKAEGKSNSGRKFGLRYQNQAREILRSEEGYALACAGERVWTTEKQPGIPAIPASWHTKSDAGGRLAFACP